MQPTVLKKMSVKKFRNMKDIDIEFGQKVTVISGKNGTAKSTILGLVAQIFSFDKNYITDEKIEYKTLNGKQFKSRFSDHFRLSAKHDKPGEMNVSYNVYDAYFKQDIENLKLAMTDTEGRNHRTVVRNNLPSKISDNTSRNVTHPIIYLSLNRLMPVAERNNDQVYDVDYLKDNKQDFISCCNEIIGKHKGTNVTSTKGTIDSSVVHGTDYDHESVSSGEDNVGQIVQALFSFRKLKEEYSDYHGGILIIDELDAGLFPFAQERIVDVLIHYSNKYDIQIILSSHSPTIIEKIYYKNEKEKNTKENNFKSIFLTNSYGKLEVCNDYDWNDINADLYTRTVKVSEEINLPLTNVYFEDKEAVDFFKRLITDRKTNKVLNILKDISVGSTVYMNLIEKYKIPEFTENSIVVLDGDVDIDIKKNESVILLPSSQPPDRLIFKLLYSLPEGDSFWRNSIRYNKSNFTSDKHVQKIMNKLGLNDLDSEDEYDFDKLVKIEQNKGNKSEKALRNDFKDFYNSNDIQKLLKTVKNSPLEYYLTINPSERVDFQETFVNKLKNILVKHRRVQKLDVDTYFGEGR